MSFRDILNESRRKSVRRIWAKAKIASRLAKISAPGARAAFYEIKHGLVQRAIEISPQDAHISEARLLEDGCLEIGLYMRKAGGLHTHVARHELGSFSRLSARSGVRDIFEIFGSCNKAA